MISLRRYSALLAHSELKRAILASIVGRLPVGITGLAMLLLTQSTMGSYAAAGLVTSCYVAGLACFAPLLGRAIDRWGPRFPLLATALLYPTALVGLVYAVQADFARSYVLALAAAAGASLPPITVCMRSFLRQRLGTDPLLVTAYSLESVLIETIFIVGPMLVALVVWLVSASCAVLIAAACGSGGALLFLRSPALRQWATRPGRRPSLFGALLAPGFPALLSVVLCYSVAFGLVEIGVTAFSIEAGRRPLAGILLGLMSVGSALGGLAYGSRSWHTPLPTQFATALFLMGLGVAALALVTKIWLFAGASLLAGVVMAPALAIQSQLVSHTAPPDRVTEAFTWSATSLLAGIGLGFSAGGWLLGHAHAVAVLASAGAISAAASVAAMGVLRRS